MSNNTTNHIVVHIVEYNILCKILYELFNVFLSIICIYPTI